MGPTNHVHLVNSINIKTKKKDEDDAHLGKSVNIYINL
jgi:hypothetical protein